jgi:hypothetical protein
MKFGMLLCLLVTFLWGDSAKDNFPLVTFTSAQVELTRSQLCAGCSPCVQETLRHRIHRLKQLREDVPWIVYRRYFSEKLGQKRQTPRFPISQKDTHITIFLTMISNDYSFTFSPCSLVHTWFDVVYSGPMWSSPEIIHGMISDVDAI